MSSLDAFGEEYNDFNNYVDNKEKTLFELVRFLNRRSFFLKRCHDFVIIKERLGELKRLYLKQETKQRMATMTENQQKEDISLAYLQAVCAKVGIAVEVHRRDGDGIDGVLKKTFYLHDRGRYDLTISFQLKSTCLDIGEDENEICYDLKIKNYNDLRSSSTTQKILLVHFFPKSFQDSIVHSQESLQILRCMYWINGTSFEEKDVTSTVRIKLPKDNVASPEKLNSLFQELAEGEAL